MNDALSPVMTQDGSATFDLDVYSGYAKIVVTDSADRYESQTKTVGPLVHGVNDVTFKMVNKDTSTTGSNLLELIIIVAIIVIAIVITALITRHMIKRKK